MPRINANRDSVDDRFSVLGFTVRTESPLYEIAVATDPTLFRADARARRVRRNFFSSRAQGALRARRGEAVYLLPQDVLANFVGSAKLYFGLATYRDGATGKPDFIQIPSEGNMYVGLNGLTERGLRRAVSAMTPSSYGTTPGRDPNLEWGGDALPQPAAAAPAAAAAATAPRPNGASSAVATPTAPATAASLAYDDGFGAFPVPTAPGASRAVAPVQAQEVLLRSYNGDLASQLRLFAETVQWVAGVDDTTRFPHSAICKVEIYTNNVLQGYATAFYVGRRMLLTNAHVVGLVAAVAKTTEQFTEENVTENQARDWVTQKYPGDVTLLLPRGSDDAQRQPLLAPRAEGLTPAWLNDYGVGDQELDSELLETVVLPKARRQIGAERQQLLATLVMLGLNRVAVKDGSVSAKVMFRATANDKAVVQYAQGNDPNAAATGNWGSRGSLASAQGVSTMVSTLNLNAQSDTSLSATMFGEVRLNFVSETLPLDKLADTAKLNMVQRQAVLGPRTAAPAPAAPPATVLPAAAPAQTAGRSA